MRCSAPMDNQSHMYLEASRPDRTWATNATKLQTSMQASGEILNAPLSNFEGYAPVRDMASWVQRSKAIRDQEATARYGVPPRPMNRFMLYRSAYLRVAKAWFHKNQHYRCQKQQAFSSLIGQSWKMESLELKEKYKAYEKIEKGNHEAAHKYYKYSPRKKLPSGKTKKRPRRSRHGDTTHTRHHCQATQEAPDPASYGSSWAMFIPAVPCPEAFQYSSQYLGPMRTTCWDLSSPLGLPCPYDVQASKYGNGSFITPTYAAEWDSTPMSTISHDWDTVREQFQNDRGSPVAQGVGGTWGACNMFGGADLSFW